MELISEATSNPHLIFCFCNLIIVLLIIASSRTTSQSPLDGHQCDSANISPPIDADIATERDNQEITVAENHSAAVDSYCKGEEDEPSRRIEAFIDKVDESHGSGPAEQAAENSGNGEDDELRRRIEVFIHKVYSERRSEKLRISIEA
ncbi:hypothetical protein Ancab_008859 [Ancistrocladus abbreviatus]